MYTGKYVILASLKSCHSDHLHLYFLGQIY